MEWLAQLWEKHGLPGLVIGGLAGALVALWRDRNKRLDAKDLRIQALEEARLETHKRLAEKLTDAIRSRGREPRSISPGPTSYSISTNTRRTRD